MYTVVWLFFHSTLFKDCKQTSPRKKLIFGSQCVQWPGLNKDLHRRGRCSAWLPQQQHDLGGWWFYLFTLCWCDKRAMPERLQEVSGSPNHHWQQHPLKIQPHQGELASLLHPQQHRNIYPGYFQTTDACSKENKLTHLQLQHFKMHLQERDL